MGQGRGVSLGDFEYLDVCRLGVGHTQLESQDMFTGGMHAALSRGRGLQIGVVRGSSRNEGQCLTLRTCEATRLRDMLQVGQRESQVKRIRKDLIIRYRRTSLCQL